MSRRRRRPARLAVTAVAVVLLASTGCTVKAPDPADWRELAEQTLDDVASEVATAELTLTQLDKGNLPAAYGETVLAEAEKAAGTAEETLSSVQAPRGLRARADQVLTLIGRAVDAVQAAREAAVAGQFHVPGLVRKLTELRAALDERRSRL